MRLFRKEHLKRGEVAVFEIFISGTGVSLCRGVPVQSDDAAKGGWCY